MHDIQKTHVLTFHDKLLGEVDIIPKLFVNFSHSVRIELESMS